MKNSYFSIKRDFENEIIIEKSRFIATAKRVFNEDEAKNFVLSVKSKYSDATHNCYAYVADENGFYVKFSDDGEPQGTAGLPMLEAIKGRNLFNTAVVVTRYFGGIKLGTGGLARAYGDSVLEVINKAGTVENVYSAIVKANVNFSLYPIVLKYLKGQKSNILNTDFDGDGAILTFAIPKLSEEKVRQDFLNYSSGKCNILVQNYEYCEY